VGSSWKDAGQEQRNQLAHTIFESLRIEDNTIKGVTPRIEFTPLLVLNHLTHLAQAADASLLEEKCQLCRTSGSDGDSIITSDFFTVNLLEIQKILTRFSSLLLPLKLAIM
jgi:hypothetical protein